MADRVNMVSKEHAAGATYEEDTRRSYLLILASFGEAVTCAVGGGDALTIPAGGYWEPFVVPTSELVLTGHCMVVTDTRHS